MTTPSPEDGCFVTIEQLAAVQDGYVETLKRLGTLANCVKLFRVSFERVPGTDTCAPSIQVFFEDPLGTECSHSSGYQHIGRGMTSPTSQEIADTLCAEHILPTLIRRHLVRGAEKLASVNAAYKRLSDEGYRITFHDPSRSDVCFSAGSFAAAYERVAEVLRIKHPFSQETFEKAGAKTFYHKFNVPIFPRQPMKA